MYNRIQSNLTFEIAPQIQISYKLFISEFALRPLFHTIYIFRKGKNYVEKLWEFQTGRKWGNDKMNISIDRRIGYFYLNTGANFYFYKLRISSTNKNNTRLVSLMNNIFIFIQRALSLCLWNTHQFSCKIILLYVISLTCISSRKAHMLIFRYFWE